MRAFFVAAFSLAGIVPSLASALPPADIVVIYKADRVLELYHAGDRIASYPIHLGFQPMGLKTREGDGRTPEGLYTIDAHNPNSKYHLSLQISYPGPEDRASAAALGLAPGGQVMIHGLPNGVKDINQPGDWTNGCIAVDNKAIEEIYASVQDGTPVMIVP